MAKRLPYRVLDRGGDRGAWLRARQGGVGASESAAVLGLSSWGTAVSVYAQKIKDTVEDVSTDLMEFGHLAEPLMVAFMRAHPERFAKFGRIRHGRGLLQSREWPWLLCTIDRLVDSDVGPVPFELKSVGDWATDDWKDAATGDWRPPPVYYVQVQQQLAVFGAPFAYIAAWLGKDRLEVMRVDRDDTLIERDLVGTVGDFWHYNVEARIPPVPVTAEDLMFVYPGDRDAEPLIADPDLYDLIGQWRIAAADGREADTAAKELKKQIHAAVGDHETVVAQAGGKPIHTLKSQATSRGVDYDRLEYEFPDAYKACVRPAGRTRVHRATKEPL